MPEQGRIYHQGSTVPILGAARQLPSGLWVPTSAATGASPIDNFGVYVTFENVFGTRVSLEQVIHWTKEFNRTEMLRAIGVTLRLIDKKHDLLSQFENTLLSALPTDASARLAACCADGQVLLSRQGLLVLAKIAAAFGDSRTTPEELSWDVGLGLLTIAAQDLLGARTAPDAAGAQIAGLPARIAIELVANQWFNRNLDEANFVALHERRWNRTSLAPVREIFEEVMEYPLDAQVAMALGSWAAVVNTNNPVVKLDYLRSLGIHSEEFERVLGTISIGVDEASHEIRTNEMQEQAFAWNFDTFERYPAIRISSEEIVVPDLALLLSRCLGWAPVYDVSQRLPSKDGRRVAHQLAKASEEYTLDVLESMYATGGAKRLFGESEIRGAWPSSRNADAAVDFGDAWVVFEVTARRLLRDFIHAVSVQAFREQIDVVLDEVEQIAGTARNLAIDSGRLTGAGQSHVPVGVYPVVVMIEGFPSSPVTLSQLRHEVNERGLFDGVDAAPIEVIDLVELEMIESVVDGGGPDLPALLRDRAESNFHMDSVRNFLLARSDLALRRTARADDAFAGPFDRVIKRLREAGADE